MTDPITQFAAEKVPEHLHGVFDRVRTIIKHAGPELVEGMRGGTEKYYGVPVYRLNRGCIVLSPSQKYLTISFARGGQFTDERGLLGGAGRTTRTLRIASEDEIDEPALADFVRQAIALDVEN